MAILDIFKRKAKVEKVRDGLIRLNDGAWVLETGPLHQTFTVKSVFLQETGKTFAEVLKGGKISSHYLLGGPDAGQPPEAIELDEPFTYVDWFGPKVWKLYRNVGGTMELHTLFDETVDETQALNLAQRAIKETT